MRRGVPNHHPWIRPTEILRALSREPPIVVDNQLRPRGEMMMAVWFVVANVPSRKRVDALFETESNCYWSVLFVKKGINGFQLRNRKASVVVFVFDIYIVEFRSIDSFSRFSRFLKRGLINEQGSYIECVDKIDSGGWMIIWNGIRVWFKLFKSLWIGCGCLRKLKYSRGKVGFGDLWIMCISSILFLLLCYIFYILFLSIFLSNL